jgi:hypothetical protein
MMKTIPLLLTAVFTLAAACSKTTVVQSRYVVVPETEEANCRYTWCNGDYWEFLAWALLDDIRSAEVLAITAGYPPDSLPAPGAVITVPIPENLEDAVENRMKAARLVRSATEARETDPEGCLQLLVQASEIDSAWSVPVTNITVLLLEQNRTEEALELLAPLSHKNIPALILAGIDWQNGNTRGALDHLSEAMITPDPRPEVLAATGIALAVTGEREQAGSIMRQFLENPDAPSELRVLVMRYVLMLTR